MNILQKDKERKSRTNLYIAIFGIVVFVIIPLYYNYTGVVSWVDPEIKSQEIADKMQSELEKIKSFPGATLDKKLRIAKRGRNGFTSYEYSTDANYIEVLTYYDSEMKINGWTFENIKDSKYMGVSYPGKKVISYKKGDLIITISYSEISTGKTNFVLLITTENS